MARGGASGNSEMESLTEYEDTNISELIEYYKNLLIIQYSNKPKAVATINALVTELISDGIIFKIRDAFNVDTAIGVQLDIIGMWVGVDRYFNVTEPENYFRFTDYIEVDPDDHLGGFVDYAEFDDADQGNGFLNYNSVLTVQNRLNDDDFRTIIKLKIIQNNSNHSHKSIDDSLFQFFEGEVRMFSDGNMEMTYFLSNNITQIIQAAIIKGIFPRPMGVGIRLIENSSINFGFTTYKNLDLGFVNPYITGFATYDNYGIKEGSTLKYNQIIGV